MAFSLGNIIKNTGSTLLKTVAPVAGLASSVYNVGKQAVSALTSPSSSTPSSNFSVSGNGSNGVVTNAPGVSVPVNTSLPAASTSTSVLPAKTTPIAVQSPSVKPLGQTYATTPTVPSTVSTANLAAPGTTNFATVPPPTTPMNGAGSSSAFTSTPQATPPAGVGGTSTPGTATATPSGTSLPSDATTPTSDAEIRATQNKILGVSEKLGGKAAALVSQEAKAKVPEYQQQLNDVTSQINQLNSDAAAEQIRIEGKPIANVFQSRQINAVERMRTVKVLGLSAVASALQGNIALAKDYAQKAVDAEFSPLEAELNTLKTQLEYNQGNFDRAEKLRAEKLTIALNDREQALTDAREKKTQINNIALEAAKNGADADTLNAILGSNDLASALGAARSSLAKNEGIGVYGLSEAQANIASKLTDDFEKASGNFSQVRDAYGKIQASQQGTGISDTSLIFSYMKMLDPGSVVREGEFATVAQAGGVPQQILQAYNKALNGEKLDQKIRDQILSTSGSLYQKAIDTQSNITQQFNSRAQAYGIPTDLVTRDLSAGTTIGGGNGSTMNPSQDQVYARLKSIYPTADDAAVRNIASQYLANPSRLSELGFTKDPSMSQNYSLGQLSQKFESNGNPGAIGYDSTGGLSYGTYQLAHSNAKSFIDQSVYASLFKGIPFNSSAWQSKWREIAAKDPNGFQQAQHDYIEKTHFLPQIQKLAQAGINVDTLSPVLKDVIWSTAVQHGPATNIVLNVLKSAKNLADADIIRRIYDARWNGGRNFASSTSNVKNGVKNRFFGPSGELNTALAMLRNNQGMA